MTDDEHEADLDRNSAAIVAQIRAMHADDESDSFEEFVTSLSVLCGTVVVNLNALAADRAGVAAIATEIDDRNIVTAAMAIHSIIIHGFQLMKSGLEE